MVGIGDRRMSISTSWTTHPRQLGDMVGRLFRVANDFVETPSAVADGTSLQTATGNLGGPSRGLGEPPPVWINQRHHTLRILLRTDRSDDARAMARSRRIFRPALGNWTTDPGRPCVV